MKMYKKKKLQYKDGYIVKDGKVIGIDNNIVDLFNKLEDDYQYFMHQAKNNITKVVASDYTEETFARLSERGNVFAHVEAKTPELDAMVEKTMKIMNEIDAIEDAEKCNEYLKTMQPIIQFANDKRIVDCKQVVQHRFDLPSIGNPLELDAETLSRIITMMFE